MSINANKLAIRNALRLVSKDQPDANSKSKKHNYGVLPTSRTKAAIDLLAGNTQESLPDDLNLRQLSDALFNWSGNPRSTKATTKALGKALQVEGHYAQTVEFVAFVAALAPLLESDRIVRLLDLPSKVTNAYSPTRYTLHFHNKLKQLFSKYSSERVEKLAASLWIDAHNGRWWDITAGQGLDNVGQQREYEPRSLKQLTDDFYNSQLIWSPEYGKTFSKIKRSEKLMDYIHAYLTEMKKGEVVNPDVALFMSHIPWLNADERAESPIENLVSYLLNLSNNITGFELPDKPKSFSAMFPNIMLYAHSLNFPFPKSVYNTDRSLLCSLDGSPVTMELVSTAAVLAENRTYMGNCTWSYKGRMENGTYALYRIHHKDIVYNGGMKRKGNAWAFDQINGRFNRGGVPEPIISNFKRFINNLPVVTVEEQNWIDNVASMKNGAGTQKKYKYRV